MATARSVIAMSRPWSEWAATPPATWRAKWRAAIVGRSAPQMPVFSSASLPTRRHGPMLQMRQQAPFSPIGQGFIVSARLNAVSMPQSSACASISMAAGSMLLAAAGSVPSCFTSSMSELLRPRTRAREARKPSAGAWTGQSGGGSGVPGAGQRSVFAVVPRHGEVGRIGGGDADPGCGPGGLVGGGSLIGVRRRRTRPRSAGRRWARAGARGVVLEAHVRLERAGRDGGDGSPLQQAAHGEHVVIGPHPRHREGQFFHRSLLVKSPMGHTAKGARRMARFRALQDSQIVYRKDNPIAMIVRDVTTRPGLRGAAVRHREPVL